MITIKILKDSGFFTLKNAIIAEGKKFGVNEIAVAVSPPNITGLSLVFSAPKNFTAKEQAEFSEALNKLLGDKINFSLFDRADIEELIITGSVFANIYACLLEKSVSLELFSPDESLEEQCNKNMKKLKPGK